MIKPQSLGVWLLALGQTLTYAGVYYGFPALLPDLISQTGWAVGDLALGPTLGFLVMAGMLPITGRMLDHGHGAALMLGGAGLVALGLAALSQVTALWQWWAIWAAIGAAQSACLYETCFAQVTRVLAAGAPQGLTARAAITRITLVAGFAGTLAFPLGHWWGEDFGGQGAMLPFAALALLSVPINFAGLASLGHARKSADHPAPPAGALAAAMARPVFWGLMALISAIWAAHGILLTYILMLFGERGASAGMAALAASCIGPAQVLARLVMLAGEARVSNQRATIFALISIVAAGVVLLAAGTSPALIFAFAALQGAGMGLMSILKPVLVADLLGRSGFGAVSAALSVGPVLAAAAAPALGAVLLAHGGPAVIYAACLALAILALILGLAILQPRRVLTR